MLWRMNVLLTLVSISYTLLTAQAQFAPERVVASGKLLLMAEVSRVFPMFEPEGEKQWAEGWEPTPIYPPKMPPAEGTVFQTTGSKGKPSIWIITRYVPNETIEYSVVTAEHDTTQISIACHKLSSKETSVAVTYRITGLSPKGNAFARMHSAHFHEILDDWQDRISDCLAKR